MQRKARKPMKSCKRRQESANVGPRDGLTDRPYDEHYRIAPQTVTQRRNTKS